MIIIKVVYLTFLVKLTRGCLPKAVWHRAHSVNFTQKAYNHLNHALRGLWLCVNPLPTKLGGVVMGIGFPVGAGLVTMFFPNTPWATSSFSIWATIAGFVILGIVLAVWLWLRGIKTEYVEERELILAIPTTLNNMNIRRNQVVKDVIAKSKNSNDYSDIFNIALDLWMYYTGTKIETINTDRLMEEIAIYLSNPEGDNYINRLKDNLVTGVAMIRMKTANTNELEVCRLVHTFVDKHINIESKLNKEDGIYKHLTKNLKYQREHFRSLEGANSINNYIDYSKGYNESELLLVSLDTIENWVGMMPQIQGLDKLMQVIVIFRSYPERVQELMNNELAKVGESIGEYLKRKN